MPAPTPLRRPARLRRRAAARPGQRRRVLHHVRHHFPAKFVLRPAHPAGARRGVARAFGYGPATRVLASAPFCGAFGFSTLVSGLAQARRGLLPGVRRGGLGARDSRTRHHLRQQRGLTGIMRRAWRPGVGAAVRFRQLHPGAGRHAGPARQQDVPLTGLYGSSELQALAAGQDDAGPGDVSARLLPGGALVHPERGYARAIRKAAPCCRRDSRANEIRSPSLMLGYLDNPEATARAFTDDGYFKTGDLGYALSEQQFVFQARMGDSLRLAGFLVNPAEIEQVVESRPACAPARWWARRADKTVPYAFVLLQPGARRRRGLDRRLQGRNGGLQPAGFTALDAFPSIESANSVKIQTGCARWPRPCSPPPRDPNPPTTDAHAAQALRTARSRLLQAAALFPAISRTAAGGPASRSAAGSAGGNLRHLARHHPPGAGPAGAGRADPPLARLGHPSTPSCPKRPRC